MSSRLRAVYFSRNGTNMPRVLIGEDKEPIRQMVRAILTRNGYDVMLANGGVAAIDAMNRKDYDAVVLDISMPDVSGIDVIGYLNAQRPDVKCILLMSAGKPADIAIAADNPSVRATLRKPFDII